MKSFQTLLSVARVTSNKSRERQTGQHSSTAVPGQFFTYIWMPTVCMSVIMGLAVLSRKAQTDDRHTFVIDEVSHRPTENIAS